MVDLNIDIPFANLDAFSVEVCERTRSPIHFEHLYGALFASLLQVIFLYGLC